MCVSWAETDYVCVPCFRNTRSTGDQTSARMGGALYACPLTCHTVIRSGVSIWNILQDFLVFANN